MGSHPQNGTGDQPLITQVSAATFPILLLGRDDEVSLSMLQKHAEVTINMMGSHKIEPAEGDAPAQAHLG